MTSNNLPLISLNNPLIFMDNDFLKEELLKGKYSKGEIIPISINEFPYKILFKFSEQSLIDDFISEYNNKPI